jgi:hypothetical protein
MDQTVGYPDAGTHGFMAHFPATAVLMAGPSRALEYDLCQERYLEMYGGPKPTDDWVISGAASKRSSTSLCAMLRRLARCFARLL